VGRITGRFLDWIVVASGALILLGAVLVSRAANEGLLENDLISPWHVSLYAGVFLAGYALLASTDRSRGSLWRSELPDGYAIAGLGLLLFVAGVVADIVWGSIWGAGASVVSLFTPTHLLAVAGIALILLGPVRAPLRHAGRHVVDRLPAVIALGLVLGLAGWLTQYANPVTQVIAREGASADILRDKGEIWTMNADGARQTRLTQGDREIASLPAVSPDGTLVAASTWSHVPGGDPTQPAGVTSSIEVLDARDGKVLRTIAGQSGWLTTPVWSPNGRTLAVTINHQPSVQPTPEARVPTPPANGPQPNEPPAPAGAGSGSSGWEWDIALVSSDGSAKPRILDSTASTDVATAWSSDGTKLLAHSDRSGNYEIDVIDPATGSEQDLTNNPAGDTWAAWSPDGRTVAFSSDRGGHTQVWVMNADGSSQRQLTSEAGNNWLPAWSPDGRQIAYLSDRDGNVEIYRSDATGGGDVNLTHSSDRDEWLTAQAWTRDGNEILYTSTLRDAGENPLSLPLAATGIILQSILLVAVLLLARRLDRLPVGAITVVLVISTAVLAAVSGEYQFIVSAAAAGVVADLLVWWLHRTRPGLELRVMAFAVPALLMAAYFGALAATGGLAWGLEVVISAVGLAGATGLLTSYLASGTALATAPTDAEATEA
jgi:Tol biopolymer transport system component